MTSRSVVAVAPIHPQDLLRHNHIQTTAHYFTVDVRDMKQVFARVHPRQKWRQAEMGRSGKMKEAMATQTEPKVELPAGYVYSHITKIPGVCGGRPCIDHIRVRVVNVVFLQKEDYTPEQMLEQYPDLNFAQVHAALAYYYDHPDENRCLYRRGRGLGREVRARQGRVPEQTPILDLRLAWPVDSLSTPTTMS